MLLNKLNFSAARFASTDEIRLGISKLKISGAGTEATNGHVLVRVAAVAQDFKYNEEFSQVAKCPIGTALEEDSSVIVEAKDALKVEKMLFKRSTIPVLNDTASIDLSTEGALVLSSSHDLIPIRTELELSKETYPDTQAVWPKESVKATVCINVKYLRLLADFLKDADRDGQVKLQVTGPHSAIIFEARVDGQEITGLLMPLKEQY